VRRLADRPARSPPTRPGTWTAPTRIPGVRVAAARGRRDRRPQPADHRRQVAWGRSAAGFVPVLGATGGPSRWSSNRRGDRIGLLLLLPDRRPAQRRAPEVP